MGIPSLEVSPGSMRSVGLVCSRLHQDLGSCRMDTGLPTTRVSTMGILRVHLEEIKFIDERIVLRLVHLSLQEDLVSICDDNWLTGAETQTSSRDGSHWLHSSGGITQSEGRQGEQNLTIPCK